jgi:hypothetical protein
MMETESHDNAWDGRGKVSVQKLIMLLLLRRSLMSTGVALVHGVADRSFVCEVTRWERGEDMALAELYCRLTTTFLLSPIRHIFYMLYVRDTRTITIHLQTAVSGAASAYSQVRELAVTSDLLVSNLAMSTCEIYANFSYPKEGLRNMLAYYMGPCNTRAYLFYQKIYNMTCHAWLTYTNMTKIQFVDVPDTVMWLVVILSRDKRLHIWSMLATVLL